MKKKTILNPDHKNDQAEDQDKKAAPDKPESPAENPTEVPENRSLSDADESTAHISPDPDGSPSRKFDRIDVSSRLINMVLDMSLPSQLKLLGDLDKSGYERARKFVRKPHVFVVDCETEDTFFQEYIKDISAGGLFLKSEHPLIVGQEIRMTFQLPHHEKIFHVLGRVARISRDGVGIRFVRHEPLKPKREEEDD